MTQADPNPSRDFEVSRVLVATDFSEEAQEATKLAHAIARSRAAELLVHHVSTFSDMAFLAPEPAYVPRSLWLRLWQREEKEIEERLAQAKEKLGPQSGSNVSVSTSYSRGGIAESLVEVARLQNCELVVLGARAASLPHRFLFGSVAARVAKQVHCPVLIARSAMSAGCFRTGTFSRVLVGVDYSPVSSHLVDQAVRFVSPDGVARFVHIWQPPTLLHSDDEFGTLLLQAQDQEIERIQAFVVDLPAHVKSESGVEMGSPARELLRKAQDTAADLIIVGSHGPRGLERAIGTVAERILWNAESSVLLVPRS